jgi:hypothetical protein
MCRHGWAGDPAVAREQAVKGVDPVVGPGERQMGDVAIIPRCGVRGFAYRDDLECWQWECVSEELDTPEPLRSAARIWGRLWPELPAGLSRKLHGVRRTRQRPFSPRQSISTKSIGSCSLGQPHRAPSRAARRVTKARTPAPIPNPAATPAALSRSRPPFDGRSGDG